MMSLRRKTMIKWMSRMTTKLSTKLPWHKRQRIHMFRVSGTVRKGSKTVIYRHHFLFPCSLLIQFCFCWNKKNISYLRDHNFYDQTHIRDYFLASHANSTSESILPILWQRTSRNSSIVFDISADRRCCCWPMPWPLLCWSQSTRCCHPSRRVALRLLSML